MALEQVNTYEEPQGESAEYVQEMLEKADSLEQPDDRPEWLPEKFQSPEEMARAYRELESKLGRNEPEVVEEDDSEEESEDIVEEGDEEEDTDTEGVDFDALSQEFAENGVLSEESYKLLEDAGIPKHIVDSYIEGQTQLAQQMQQSAYDLAGGQEQYQKMIDWAAQALPEQDIEAFNDALVRGPSEARLAIKGLVAQYQSEYGSEPKLLTGATNTQAVRGFESTAQLTAAMSDPRYNSDPAYRNEVARRLAVSSIF